MGAQATKAAKQTSNEPIEVTMNLEKQTKNALRYQEEGTSGENRGKIGTLYVQKTTLPDSPASITVTITRNS